MKKTLLAIATMVAGQVAASCLLEYIEHKKKEKAQQK